MLGNGPKRAKWPGKAQKEPPNEGTRGLKLGESNSKLMVAFERAWGPSKCMKIGKKGPRDLKMSWDRPKIGFSAIWAPQALQNRLETSKLSRNEGNRREKSEMGLEKHKKKTNWQPWEAFKRTKRPKSHLELSRSPRTPRIWAEDDEKRLHKPFKIVWKLYKPFQIVSKSSRNFEWEKIKGKFHQMQLWKPSSALKD